MESKCKNRELQKDSESEIILKSIKCKFYEVTTFSSKACQLSLSQVRVILHFSWRKYTLTISVEGNFGCHITEGGVDAEVFQQFLDQYLIPKLMPFNGTNPHSVVILDNAAIHHVESVVASLEGLGVLVHFLPPYYIALIKMQLRNVLLK